MNYEDPCPPEQYLGYTPDELAAENLVRYEIELAEFPDDLDDDY